MFTPSSFNPAFEGMSNEDLYQGMCDGTIPLDNGLLELQKRLSPIILNISRNYLISLSWTFDNAMGEALILLWELVKKRSFHFEGPGFHSYFAHAWENRLNNLFGSAIAISPVTSGNVQIGWNGDQPVFACKCEFHPKAEKNRELKKKRQAAYLERKRAANPRPPKPILTPEERAAHKKQWGHDYWANLPPEKKAAIKARRTELRLAKYAAETPKERERRLAVYRAAETPERRNARRERQKAKIASETPEERAARLERERLRRQAKIATETPEEKALRLEKDRIRARNRLASETPEQREARLARQREWNRKNAEAKNARERERIARETPEQREERLAKRRASYAAQPVEKLEARRKQMRDRYYARKAKRPPDTE